MVLSIYELILWKELSIIERKITSIQLSFLVISFTLGSALIMMPSIIQTLIIPLAIITVALSIILDKDITEVISFAATTWTPYTLLLGFIIPCCLLGLSFIKKEKH